MEFVLGHLDLTKTYFWWKCETCGKGGDFSTKPQDYECKYIQDALF